MASIVTLDIFKKLFPRAVKPEEIHAAFVKYFPIYEINTTNRRAMFLAQCGHESGEFSIFQENLNYSVNGLLKTFPKYFKTEDEAKSYARQPEKIANKIYANRMNNGDEKSGEGYKFRGRGFIQLTGKANYSEFAKYKDLDLDKTINYLSTIEGAVESALWFWKTRNINTFADKDDILGSTKKINGGTIGLEDRKKHYEEIKKALS